MSLPWIKVCTSLFDHPRAVDLAEDLGSPLAWAHLVALWGWCAEYAPRGRIAGRAPDCTVERAARWAGGCGRFIDAAITAGWIARDGADLVVVGWAKHQRPHLDKAERDRARLAARRADDRTTVARLSRDGRASVAGERRGEEKEQVQVQAFGFPNAPPAPRKHPQSDEDQKAAALPLPDDDRSSPGTDAAPPPPVRTPKPRAARRPPDPALHPDEAAHVAERDAYRDRYRALSTIHTAEFDRAGALAFRRARKRHPLDHLLRALEGLQTDPKGRTLGLRAALADEWVLVGLRRAAAGTPANDRWRDTPLPTFDGPPPWEKP